MRCCKLVSDQPSIPSGSVIRRKLQLRPVRASAGYVIPPEKLPKVDRLYERYGIPLGTGEAGSTAAIPEPDFP